MVTAPKKLNFWPGGSVRSAIIRPHEAFTGAHVGPGILALYFFGDHR